MMLSQWHVWMDLCRETVAMVFIVITQVVILRAMRNEMRARPRPSA